MNIKINKIKEELKDFGKNYGSPIIIVDIDEKLGTEIDIAEVIGTLNKFSYKKQEVLFIGNPFFYKEELYQMIDKLLYKVEIVCNSFFSPRDFTRLTNVSFCVILDSSTDEEILKEYTYLSSFNRSYFLFDASEEKELEKIRVLEKKYKLSPIYITCTNDNKYIESFKKVAVKNNWNLTPRM